MQNEPENAEKEVIVPDPLLPDPLPPEAGGPITLTDELGRELHYP